MPNHLTGRLVSRLMLLLLMVVALTANRQAAPAPPTDYGRWLCYQTINEAGQCVFTCCNDSNDRCSSSPC